MKRTIAMILGVAVVVAASAAFADDQPASSSSPTTTTSEQKESPAVEKAEKAATHHHHKMMAKHAMVDLNSASKEDLAKLPGVSEDLADKIIAARPFKSRGELLSKKVLTKAEYHKIRGWVSAKSETASK